MLKQFKIELSGLVSDKFLSLGISDFHAATGYVSNLKYGRNTNKADIMLVLSESKGTCSSKHALLAKLCREQKVNDVRLYIGIYKMNEKNTPGVGSVLSKYNIEYLPEAHCYLKYNDCVFDFTGLEAGKNAINDFMEEVEISPENIGEYKTYIHQSFFKKWTKGFRIDMSFDELWKVREECIKALSEKI